jgi:putative membrane protein
MEEIVKRTAAKTATLATFACLAIQPVFGQDPTGDWHPKTIGEAAWHSVAFGLLGITMVIVGFKLFDLVLTRLDLEAEILKGNIAAAILSGAAIIATAIIVASAIS